MKLSKITARQVIICLVLVGAYPLLCWNSQRQIDNFCNSIDTSSNISALRMLAQRAGVSLSGPDEFAGASGPEVRAVAVSPFTMGDYGCDIEGASLTGKVLKKRLGWSGRGNEAPPAAAPAPPGGQD